MSGGGGAFGPTQTAYLRLSLDLHEVLDGLAEESGQSKAYVVELLCRIALQLPLPSDEQQAKEAAIARGVANRG